MIQTAAAQQSFFSQQTFDNSNRSSYPSGPCSTSSTGSSSRMSGRCEPAPLQQTQQRWDCSRSPYRYRSAEQHSAATTVSNSSYCESTRTSPPASSRSSSVGDVFESLGLEDLLKRLDLRNGVDAAPSASPAAHDGRFGSSAEATRRGAGDAAGGGDLSSRSSRQSNSRSPPSGHLSHWAPAAASAAAFYESSLSAAGSLRRHAPAPYQADQQLEQENWQYERRRGAGGSFDGGFPPQQQQQQLMAHQPHSADVLALLDSVEGALRARRRTASPPR
ncbi:hypothetical protein JKP88DRAFT_313144, partial [Tribonema minus]